MSGIAAIFRSDGAPVAADSVEQVVQAMAYRARDGRGARSVGACALGFCALHTCAADRGSTGPASAADGRHHITFDGYLANGPELRSNLSQRGVSLRGERDAETVLHAYAVWGEDILPRLEGEFAFVIWDSAERRLIAARDHHGLRPLTWHWDGRRLVIASDIAGVLAALEERPDINSGYLVEHLANEWYSQDETVWQGVRKLRPAHCLTLSVGDTNPQIREYWQLPVDVTIRHASDAAYAEHYRGMLDEAVGRAAVSDAPIAAEVSGGLDSSAVFALAARAHDEGGFRAPDVLPFSLRGYDADHSDEIAYARAVAAQSRRTLTEIPLFEPALPDFAAQSEADRTIAFAPNTAMFGDAFAAMAATGCRVGLTGQGGDTWLNGTNAQFNQALRLRDWGGAMRSIAADYADYGARYALRKAMRQGLGLLAPEAIKALLRQSSTAPDDPAEQLCWLSDEAKRELARRREAFWAELSSAPAHERHKWQRIKEPFTTLAMEMLNLTAARNGIELRSPMLSRRFITFAAALPEHCKRRGALRKYVHREAMAAILPETVRLRRDKAYFDTTFRGLQSATRDYCMSQPALPPLDALLHPVGTRNLFDRFYDAEIDDGAIWELWGIYSCQLFVAQTAAANGVKV